MSIDQFLALHEQAAGRWAGASWTHELRRDGRVVLAQGGSPIYCDGEMEDCDTCAEATAAAAKAETEAAFAESALRRCDLAEAASRARRAADIEQDFGDCPTWGPFADACERALADLAD